MLNKGIGKLADEYQDPGAALSAIEHALADLLKEKYSLLKLNPGLRENQTFLPSPGKLVPCPSSHSRQKPKAHGQICPRGKEKEWFVKTRTFEQGGA
jgi:hypothetical protein